MMEVRLTEYLRLFRKSLADLPQFPKGVPKAVREPDEEPEWRLCGFLFTVNQQTDWTPDSDTDALLRIGRWLAGYETLGGIGAYKTMRDRGFAIHFSREKDAKSFEFQCLEKDHVFSSVSDLPMLQSRPSFRRKPSTQLPSGASRSLSKPFSDKLMKNLYSEVSSDSGRFQLKSLKGVIHLDPWPGYEAYKRAQKR